MVFVLGICFLIKHFTQSVTEAFISAWPSYGSCLQAVIPDLTQYYWLPRSSCHSSTASSSTEPKELKGLSGRFVSGEHLAIGLPKIILSQRLKVLRRKSHVQSDHFKRNLKYTVFTQNSASFIAEIGQESDEYFFSLTFMSPANLSLTQSL